MPDAICCVNTAGLTPYVEAMILSVNKLRILYRNMLLLLNFQRGVSTFVHFMY